MDLFYGEINGRSAVISDEDQNHISKVLRMKEGSRIEITDGLGNVASGPIYFEGKKVFIQTPEIRAEKPKLATPIQIAIAPTKNIDRTEFFVEKATELGVGEITFLLTENSERKNINFERMKKKVIAASKQSQRYFFPKVNELIKLYDFLNKTKNIVAAHCDLRFDRVDINELRLKENTCFLIGPEGDFSEHEIKHLQSLQIPALTLGPQRLRTETAGIFVAAWAYGKQI